MNKCETCKFWKEFTSLNYGGGECTGLLHNGKLEIELETGWSGGYVDAIFTEPDFGCTNHEVREELL